MRLSCESCGAPIPAADVNIEQLVAKCRRCDAVFSFGPRLSHAARPPRRRPPLPRGLTIESGEPLLPDQPTYRTAPVRERGPLVITRRWFRAHHVFLLFFCLFWDGFLVLWYVMGATQGAPAMMFAFPLIHVAIGVGLTYGVITGFVNRTTIRVADGMLTVRHGPLPWIGNVDLPTSGLRQLYLRRNRHRSKHGGYYSWDVRAETDEMTSLKVVSRIPDREQAEFIEWATEEHLGIRDDPSRSRAA